MYLVSSLARKNTRPVKPKISERDDKALTSLKVMDHALYFGTDTTPNSTYPFGACINFYLYSKCVKSEILKLDIISSSFH